MNTRRIFRTLLLVVAMLLICTTAAYADSIKFGSNDVYTSSGTSYWLQTSSGLTQTGASADAYNVKFDKSTNTITLNNASFSTLTIDVNGAVTIALEGSNSLGSSTTSSAIQTTSKVTGLTFADGSAAGVGSLDIKAKGYGIEYKGSGALTVNGGNITIYADANGSGMAVYGVNTSGKTFVMNGGKVDITAFSNSRTDVYGITCGSSGTLEMHGGDLSVYAKSQKSRVYAVYTGERGQKLVYTGGNMTVRAEDSGPNDLSNYNDAFSSFFTKESVAVLKSDTIIKVDPSSGLGTNMYTWNNNASDFQAFCPYAYVEIKGKTYTVTYTDGVEDEEIFADQSTSDLYMGAATPAFSGTPERTGYTFGGWNPEVASTVSGNATYVAQWTLIPTYTVTYTDGVADEDVFADQTTNGLVAGAATPAFIGTPERTGYKFDGWNPEVVSTVSDNATYVAQWTLIPTYTVTYTDGVADEEVFADQATNGLVAGAATPAFKGTPERTGYHFVGWTPSVAEKVSGNATYTAQWSLIPTYTVTYTDGVADEDVFADQTTNGLVAGAATPAFKGAPERTGYAFAGWNPKVTSTVSGNAVYAAQWVPLTPELPQTGDEANLLLLVVLSGLSTLGMAMFLRKKKNA